MLLQVTARLLLPPALLVAADAEAEEEVDQQHGEAAAHRHGEAIDAEAAGIQDDHDDPADDHHDPDPVADQRDHAVGRNISNVCVTTA
jgi:hypothetical protein